MKDKLYGLDLFSGIGGNSLALSDYINTVAYCEQDKYAQHVLLSRMSEGKLPNRPIWDDVCTLQGSMLPNIDIIVGGFPCQDISVAGNGAGLEGKRSGLFYEIIRLTKETNPSFVFLENVPAIRTRGLREVIREFTDLGYDCRWTCVSAAELGAPHVRKRWFLLAHHNSGSVQVEQGWSSREGREGTVQSQLHGTKEYVANNNGLGLQATGTIEQTEGSTGNHLGSGYWSVEPNVGRVVHGLPFRMDRIKCLGNAVVPLQAKEAFERLMGLK